MLNHLTDDKVLFATDQQGIESVIPLNRNTHPAIDARQLVLDAAGSYQDTPRAFPYIGVPDYT
jgi:hypothetical protein